MKKKTLLYLGLAVITGCYASGPQTVYCNAGGKNEDIGGIGEYYSENGDEAFITDDAAKSLSVYYGDFDYDGKITLMDAKESLMLALGIKDVTEEQKLFGDIDGKGISLTDAKEYLRMSLGIIPVRKTDISITFPCEIRRFSSEDGKVEAVHVAYEELWKYISTRCYFEFKTLPQYYERGNRMYKIHIDNSFGTKLSMMELFDMSWEDFDKYDFFYSINEDLWCDKFGYENLKVSLENTDNISTIKVNNYTTCFADEFKAVGPMYNWYKNKFFYRIPKSELAGKDLTQIRSEFKLAYGVGLERAEDVKWSLEKIENIDEVSQSACLVTSESEVPESLRDKCDFENYDYILLTIPFNYEDCYDYGDEIFWEFDISDKKTVGEKYHSGEIRRPDDFVADTFLNGRTWISEDEESKVLNLKTNFTLYDQFYYEDIANCGTDLIKVEKGKYNNYKIKFEVFSEDLSFRSCVLDSNIRP